MRKLFALVLLFVGCGFAQELVDVDVSKFPPNIVRKSSTTENSVPKINSTTNTLVVSSITDNGTTVTITGEPVVVTRTALATTSTDGLALENLTEATVETQVQYSPRFRLRGSTWDTDSNVSETQDFWWEVTPSAAATTVGTLSLKYSRAGAAAATLYTINSSGNSSQPAGNGVCSSLAFSMASNVPTNGTMTASTTGQIRASWHRYAWTNAMITALGATTSGDITVCTLAAKTRVMQAYVVITGQGVLAGATLTGQVGTDATYSDYLAAGDLKAAANVVYGDANAECGASLPGGGLYVGHMPSYTATTAVKMRVTTDGAGGATLSGVTGSTGYVYLLTEVLP